MADPPDLSRLRNPVDDDLARVEGAVPTGAPERKDAEIAAIRALIDDLVGPDVKPAASLATIWAFSPKTSPLQFAAYLVQCLEHGSARASSLTTKQREVARHVAHPPRPARRSETSTMSYDPPVPSHAEPDEPDDLTRTMRFGRRTWERLLELAEREGVDAGVALGRAIDRQWFLDEHVRDGDDLMLRRGTRTYILTATRPRARAAKV